MVRVTYGAPRHQKKVRWFKQAKGYRGGRSKLWRTVRESVVRAWAYSYRDRQKKRQFRRLWIVRINAATRMRGMTYSQFIAGMKAQASPQPQAALRARHPRSGGVRRAGRGGQGRPLVTTLLR